MIRLYKSFEEAINKKGVTIYRVAKDTGVCSVILYNWKNGKTTPKAESLVKIAKYLDVEVSDLIGG